MKFTDSVYMYIDVIHTWQDKWTHNEEKYRRTQGDDNHSISHGRNICTTLSWGGNDFGDINVTSHMLNMVNIVNASKL